MSGAGPAPGAGSDADGAIDHYCFVRLRDDHATADGRAAIAAHLRATLAGAPEVVAVAAGVPADDSAASWDVSLVIRVADLDAWRRLAARPAIAALLDDWLPARAVVVKAWNFAVS